MQNIVNNKCLPVKSLVRESSLSSTEVRLYREGGVCEELCDESTP